jgi:hypothetical protein
VAIVHSRSSTSRLQTNQPRPILGGVRSSILFVTVLLANLGCVPSRSAIVVAPVPPRPQSLRADATWPYLSYNGDFTLPWCEYACRRFIPKDAKLLGCRGVFLSQALQQSLNTGSGVACELD